MCSTTRWAPPVVMFTFKQTLSFARSGFRMEESKIKENKREAAKCAMWLKGIMDKG